MIQQVVKRPLSSRAIEKGNEVNKVDALDGQKIGKYFQ